jgi:hypothetical protein
VVCPGEVSRLVRAIKVSRTLGQSQLNFAHTFFGFVIADESGLLSGFAPLPQPQCSKDPVLDWSWSRRQTSRLLVN